MCFFVPFVVKTITTKRQFVLVYGIKRVLPFFGLRHGIAIAAALLFLVTSLCAQDIRGQKECESLFGVAVKAEQQNDMIEAERRYKECLDAAHKLQLSKMEAAALHRIAIIKARNGKFSESLNLFERALILDPVNLLILGDFAQFYADCEDYERAETILTNAMNLDPKNPKVLLKLGEVIASQRHDRQAEGLRYMKLAVGESGAYRELARIYRSKGDISRAEFAEYKAKLAENPPNNSNIPTASPDAVIPQTQSSSAASVNSFAAVVRLPEPPVASPDTLAVRRIENFSESQKDIQPPEQHYSENPFAPVQVLESKPADKDSLVIRIILPDNSDSDKANTSAITPLPQRFPIPSGKPENPTIRNVPNNEGRNEQTSVSKADANKLSNPLRQIHADKTGLIEPAADLSSIASSHPYSAVGFKNMPHIDLPEKQEPPKSTPNPAESLSLVRTDRKSADILTPLPVREDRMLQSPSVVTARQKNSDPPVLEPQKDSSLAAGSRSEHSFVVRNAPDLLSFSLVNQTPSPAYQTRRLQSENSLDTSSHTLTRNTSLVRLPQIAAENSDAPNTVKVSVVPTYPANLFPYATADDAQMPLAASSELFASNSVPADPFPVAAAVTDKSRTSSELIASNPAPTEMSPVAAAEKPRILPLPKSLVPNPAPIDPFPAAVADRSRTLPELIALNPAPIDPLTVAITGTPQTLSESFALNPAPVNPLPRAVAEQPQTLPKSPALNSAPINPSPTVATAKPQALPATPPQLAATAPAPVNSLPAAKDPLRLAEAKKPEPLSSVPHLPSYVPMEMPKVAEARMSNITKPSPIQEEPAGFATTRKSRQKTEEPVGFARSRR